MQQPREICQVEIDQDYIARPGVQDFQKNWRAEPEPKRLQMIGDEWLDSRPSVVLRVPSAIVGGEFNYLLNPLHSDFTKLGLHDLERIPIDKRLVK
jgi:RES domain-containing protein